MYAKDKFCDYIIAIYVHTYNYINSTNFIKLATVEPYYMTLQIEDTIHLPLLRTNSVNLSVSDSKVSII